MKRLRSTRKDTPKTTKATFSDHSIRPDGLHIIGVTDEGVEIDMVMSRENALLFGWIAPEDGIEGAEKYIGDEYMRDVRRKREQRKLAEWNALAKEATR